MCWNYLYTGVLAKENKEFILVTYDEQFND